MKKRNPVAKHAQLFTVAKVEANKKHRAKKGYQKHKKAYRQAA
jgi:hypothetical protein